MISHLSNGWILLLIVGIVCVQTVYVMYVFRTVKTVIKHRHHWRGVEIPPAIIHPRQRLIDPQNVSVVTGEKDAPESHWLPYQHCKEGSVYALALIISEPQNSALRATIRRTWGGTRFAKRSGVFIMFIVGNSGDFSLRASITKEQILFGDVMVGKFEDRANNVTMRTLLGLRWATEQCPTAKFIFLGDDHLIVRFDLLVQQLKSFTVNETRNMWFGRCTSGLDVEGKPRVLQHVSKKLQAVVTSPDFCTFGEGNVLSMDAAQSISKLSSSVKPSASRPEIYFGILAKKSHVRVRHDSRFSATKLSTNRCAVLKVFSMRTRGRTSRIKNVWKEKDTVGFLQNCLRTDISFAITTAVNNTGYLDAALRPISMHPDSCLDADGKPRNIFLVALIYTHPRNFYRRRIVRETWGAGRSYLGESVHMLFVMGTAESKSVHDKIRAENAKYSDIIQADFKESFRNLTLKVILGLRWMTENCLHARYMYKGDDDTFVNFENIIRYIKSRWPTSLYRFFAGSVLVNSPRITNRYSRYYVKESEYYGQFYPPYCSGGGYVISTDVIPRLYRLTASTQLVPMEDAYQGILMKRIGVRPVTSDMFKNWGYATDPCSLRSVSVIHLSKSQDLREVWRNFTDKSVTCD